MNRPRGYTVAAVLLLGYGLLQATGTIPVLAGGAAASSAEAPPFAVTVLEFTLAVLGIVATYGVWRVQKWGVVLALAVHAVAILNALPAILFAPPAARLFAVLGVAWSAAIVVLLLRARPGWAAA